MNEKTKNVMIVILVCIICVLIFVLAFILGMKFADKEESLNNNTESKEESIDNTNAANNEEESIDNTNDVNNEEVKEDIKVVDYINKSLNKNTIDKSILEKYIVCGEPATQKELGTVTVKLPMIDSKKIGAQAFNKMLQDKYADTIESLNRNSKRYTELDVNNHNLIASVFGHYSIEYEYYNSDKYISFLINSSGGMLCGSGGGGQTSYVYDIENDKYLTNEDVIKEFNITKEKIKTKFIEKSPDLASDSYLESSLNDSFEDLYYLYIEEGFLNIGTTRGMDPASRPTIQIPIN